MHALISNVVVADGGGVGGRWWLVVRGGGLLEEEVDGNHGRRVYYCILASRLLGRWGLWSSAAYHARIHFENHGGYIIISKNGYFLFNLVLPHSIY
jgi:hypothetical protein